MARMLAALLLVATLGALPARAEDCKDCTDTKACLSHEAQDDIAVKAAQVKLKTKDMIGKREAINGLTDAQMKHMNCRSRKITAELLRALADADVDVKLLAAEKLSQVAVPDMAVQGLAAEAAAYKKQIGTTRPKKENEVAKWEATLELLGRIYESLGAVKSPAVSKVFEDDIMDSSPFVARAAAVGSAPMKGNKGIIKALYDGLKKWLGPSQQPARPEGTVEAFFAMSAALQKVVENPPTGFEGKAQPETVAKWDAWWKANGGGK